MSEFDIATQVSARLGDAADGSVRGSTGSVGCSAFGSHREGDEERLSVAFADERFSP